MIHRLYFVLLLSLFCTSLQAQLTIKGQLMLADNTPVEFCNALVLDPTDSSFIAGELIENGVLNLTVDRSECLLRITALSCQEMLIKIEKSVDLGKVVLLPSALEEVEIIAHKLPFESQNGNMKINVSNSLFMSSSSAQEILRKSPGVVVSNGDVSVIGSGQAIIYLNRKQISFATMQAIPVSQIESIEIIKNPDASYDAEGKAVILIVLKELGLEGIQGTANGHYTKGFYHLGYLDLSLQAKKGKWDFSSSANKNWGATGTRRWEDYDVKSGIPYTASSDYREKVYLPQVCNYLFGLNYRFTPKQHVSVQYNGNYSKYDLEVQNSIDQNISNSLIQIEARDTAVSLDRTNTVSVNYNWTLDSLGSSFFAGATYSSVQVSYVDAVTESTLIHSAEEVMNTNSSGNNINEIATFQLDFQKNFSKNRQLKLGVKEAGSTSLSRVELETKRGNELVNFRDDQFVYKEQILSAYMNWSGAWKKGDYQLGLRAENTKSTAFKNQNNTAYMDTTYLSLFPNFHFNTKFKNWSMSDQFSSKINRPRYSDITPYIYYLNSFTSVYGNPYIKPSFNYNFEHKFTYKKTSASLGYNFVKQPRIFINLQDDKAESTNVLQAVNVDQSEKFYVEIQKTTSVSILYNYSTVNVSYQSFKSTVYDFGNVSSTPQVYAYSYNRIAIKKWFDFEIIGEFTSAYTDGRVTMRAQGEIDLGISKSFAKDKCFAQITVNDVFQTAKFRPVNSVNDDHYTSSTTQDSRFLRVFFSYQFGKLKTPSYEHLRLDESNVERSK